MGGGGGQVVTKWHTGKGYFFTINSQMTSIDAIFICTYHTKKLNPWLNSSASCVVNYSRLSICQKDMESFEGDLSTVDIWQASETSHSKNSLGNFQDQYLAELLVQLSFDGEKCIWMLCKSKVAFLNLVTIHQSLFPLEFRAIGTIVKYHFKVIQSVVLILYKKLKNNYPNVASYIPKCAPQYCNLVTSLWLSC